MNIPIIQPPRSLDPETSRWLMDFVYQVSGALSEQEAQILALQKEVEVLKAKP